MGFSLTALAMAMFPAVREQGSDVPSILRAKRLGIQVVSGSIDLDPPPMLPQIAEVLAPPATDVTPVTSLLPRESLDIYIGFYIEDFGGAIDEFEHRFLLSDYHRMAKAMGWPQVSPKALSQALKRRGCTPRTVNRLPDGSRPTVYRFPKARKPRARKRSTPPC